MGKFKEHNTQYEGNMKIFIAQTPYHVLLSYGLAKSASDGRNLILYMPNDLTLTESHVKELIDNPDSPFLRKYYLNDGINQKRGLGDLYTIFKNSRFFKGTLKKELPCEIYVFNDGFIYNQYLINTNKKRGGVNHYVEDGSVVYSANHVTYGLLSNLASLLFLGKPFSNINILGAHSGLNHIIVAHPELIRQDLDTSKVSKIPSRVWADVEYDLMAHPPSAVQDSVVSIIDNIILLPLKDDLDKKTEAELLSLIETLDSNLEGNTLVKYHPCEKERYLPENISNRFFGVDQGLPVEILLLFHKRSIRKVIGLYYDSTALITARDLCGDAVEIISTSGIFNLMGLNANVLERIGILSPKSVEELINHIR